MRQIIIGAFRFWFRNKLWERYFFQSVRRLAGICATCEHSKVNRVIYFLIDDKKVPLLRGLQCKKCKCILSLKCRSDDKCPEGKW